MKNLENLDNDEDIDNDEEEEKEDEWNSDGNDDENNNASKAHTMVWCDCSPCTLLQKYGKYNTYA